MDDQELEDASTRKRTNIIGTGPARNLCRFTDGEVVLLDFITKRLQAGQDPSPVIRHKDWVSLLRKVQRMRQKIFTGKDGKG